MVVTANDRPLEELREEIIDQLIMNYGHGALSLEAFQRRLDRAFNETQHSILNDLVTDLELDVDKTYIETKEQKLGVNYETDTVEDVEYMVNIFGGSDRGGQWVAGKEIRIINIFGGGNVDFSEAKFAHRRVRIRFLSFFGGTTIYVPKDINTINKVICIFGGVDNKAPSSSSDRAPTIIIDGLVVFGGVTIKIKKILKERFIEFADGLKNLFSQTSGDKESKM
ncbi:MAG: hypothetical protein ACI92E_002470 [Oceanicoccus sp.]|jgi:hypothetical protein